MIFVSMAKYNLEDMQVLLEQNLLTQKNMHYNHKDYRIIRYDKSKLTQSNTSGLFRSVIYQNDTIVSYSPPKSISYDTFKSMEDITITSMEEYVEGTMMNVFWSGDTWELATRSSVGGKVSFFNVKENDQMVCQTFRDMFLNTVLQNETLHPNQPDFFSCLEQLPKHYVLSMVLQHPMNRIVSPIIEPSLYVVKVYAVVDHAVVEKDILPIVSFLPNWVKLPLPYNWSLEELECKMSTQCMDYTKVGIMIHGLHPTKGIIRTKVRNPLYEKVRKLRGNQCKLQYRYIELCQENLVEEYLNYYPEHSKWFQLYDIEIRKFAVRLHSFYMDCFVTKTATLKTYPYEYRTHMYRLHEHYKTTLREKRGRVNLHVVTQYIDRLHPSVLMYSINYSLRKPVEKKR